MTRRCNCVMTETTLPAGFIAPCFPSKIDKLPSGSLVVARDKARWVSGYRSEKCDLNGDDPHRDPPSGVREFTFRSPGPIPKYFKGICAIARMCVSVNGACRLASLTSRRAIPKSAFPCFIVLVISYRLTWRCAGFGETGGEILISPRSSGG
jgi:hypothetical protein